MHIQREGELCVGADTRLEDRISWTVVPNFFCIRMCFMEGVWFGDVHFISVLIISHSPPGHQALDPGVWGPFVLEGLNKETLMKRLPSEEYYDN